MPDNHPLAGKPVPASQLANIPRLVTAYFVGKPDPEVAAQRVAFGTSGHRGSSLNLAFNEAHILSVSQAVCDYRLEKNLTGPLFVGIDTHALAAGTAQAVVKRGGDSWFFITDDYAFGHSLEKDASDVVKKMGGKVLGAVRPPFATPDLSSFVLQAQASKAKIIGIAGGPPNNGNEIKTGAEFGVFKGGQQMAALLALITDIHSLGLPAAQGLLLTTSFYWDMDDKTREWSKR